MADNSIILEKAIEIALSKARYPVEIEVMKGCAEILSLREDGAPAQSGLETLQTQFLEQTMIVTDWKTPFRVMVVQKLRCRAAPVAACFSVRTFKCRAHASTLSKENSAAHRPLKGRFQEFPQ